MVFPVSLCQIMLHNGPLTGLLPVLYVTLINLVLIHSNEREETTEGSKRQIPIEPAHFQHAAVASDNAKCSELGKSILVKGGSAVDSVITVQLCTEAINSHSTGIAGGGFMIVYDKKSGKSSVIDFRETLPLKFKNNKEKRRGEITLVPGVLRGLEKAHKMFGKLKWKELFEPVIHLCKNGFEVPMALARAIHSSKYYIMKDSTLRELFAPKGTLLRQGAILKRPKFAKTLQKIADGGADVFYRGEIAHQIVEDLHSVGGFISLKDLRRYKAIARHPLKTYIKGRAMLSVPPPGSGALVALAVKIMAGFNWTRDDISSHDKRALTYHRIIESMKFAFAPSTFLGDPKFTNFTKEVVRYMLDEKVAERLRLRIDNTSHPVEYYGPHSTAKPVDKKGTTHISVLGPDGDAAALTSTINGYFGSKLRSKKLGFFYNNELSDFGVFWPKVYNLKEDEKVPGKRPASNASPTIFVDHLGNVSAVLGAAGGHFIPTAVATTIANLFFFGDNVKEAIDRPRLHCQLFPPTVVHESKFPVEFIKPLQVFGHVHVTNSTYDVSGQYNAAMGVVQAIVREPNGQLSAEADFRKGGAPAGF